MGRIPSPCCGKSMRVIDTRNRKSKEGSGKTKIYNIRRLRCGQCRRIHHEMPDFLVPYKRYESVLSNPSMHDVPADESIWFRWHKWFDSFVDYWINCFISIMLRTKQEMIPLNLTSTNLETALQRIGRLVGSLYIINMHIIYSTYSTKSINPHFFPYWFISRRYIYIRFLNCFSFLL
ncbi:DUF6431 domain-containing protein [Robertmurraya massiliosenegalensis]|uniref:DUF6431 domain-containing protein n=1 Tax=Robertmurraya massiliosenegalensis TaxID=1287657 RepID=UPI0021CC10BC|nr:DUF6431 domain-containing protein [Robertmurraya massiliosenegalensis]